MSQAMLPPGLWRRFVADRHQRVALSQRGSSILGSVAP
jgi:hypothetical protein